MTYSSFCIMYSTIGVDRNRLNSNGRSILCHALASCPNSAAAARSPSLCPHSGSSPPPPLRGPCPCAHAEIISVGSSSLPSSKTVNGEESRRRSNDGGQGGDLEEEHIDDASPVPKRNHRHGAIDLPAACSEFQRQLLGEKRIEWWLGTSCSGRRGGLSSGVRSASSPCMRTREGSDLSKAGGKRGGRTMACSPTGRRRCSKNPSSTGTWSSSSSDVGASGSEDAAMAVGAGEDRLG
jgi:hypothetical protein